jgi:hypothetical protein
MNFTQYRPQGLLHMIVRDSGGRVVAARRARNIVLRQGAAVVARLFSGDPGSSPVNQVQVGFATEGATTESTTLTPPADASIPKQALLSPIAPGDIKIVTDKPGAIQVQVASLFKPTVELRDVTEAGLLAGDKLYNQVVFEPVLLRPGQDVTFFWEIDFPFGH